MSFSVPLLLEISYAVVHRLDPAAVKDLQPAGRPSGYDKDFREPVAFDTEPSSYDPATGEGRVRTSARIELAPVRVPCQVEMQRFEQLNQQPPGNDPRVNFNLVLHRMDLRRLGLIDPKTSELFIRVNDRVSSIESRYKRGVSSVYIKPPGVYIWEIAPGSFGFGQQGTDLFIVALAHRERVT